jgi:hypothetical protein
LGSNASDIWAAMPLIFGQQCRRDPLRLVAREQFRHRSSPQLIYIFFKHITFFRQALIIERAAASASLRVPKTVLSFGNSLLGM